MLIIGRYIRHNCDYLSAPLTVIFVPYHFRTLSESETAVSESEMAVSESETAVSDSETAVSESKWLRKRTGTKMTVRGALRVGNK